MVKTHPRLDDCGMTLLENLINMSYYIYTYIILFDTLNFCFRRMFSSKLFERTSKSASASCLSNQSIQELIKRCRQHLENAIPIRLSGSGDHSQTADHRPLIITHCVIFINGAINPQLFRYKRLFTVHFDKLYTYRRSVIKLNEIKIKFSWSEVKSWTAPRSPRFAAVTTLALQVGNKKKIRWRKVNLGKFCDDGN